MARILPLDSDEHSQTELLLPWLANGTLEPGERARVQAHVARCERCRSVLDFQARLRTAVASAEDPGDVERDWAALRAQLQTSGRVPPPPTRERPRWAAWWPFAIALQCAVVLAAGLVLTVARTPESYRTLGSAASPPSANVLIVFRPDATESQIRAALRSVEAGVVAGPTVTDAYLLQVPALGPQVLDRLRAAPAVSKVESLVGTVGP